VFDGPNYLLAKAEHVRVDVVDSAGDAGLDDIDTGLFSAGDGYAGGLYEEPVVGGGVYKGDAFEAPEYLEPVVRGKGDAFDAPEYLEPVIRGPKPSSLAGGGDGTNAVSAKPYLPAPEPPSHRERSSESFSGFGEDEPDDRDGYINQSAIDKHIAQHGPISPNGGGGGGGADGKDSDGSNDDRHEYINQTAMNKQVAMMKAAVEPKSPPPPSDTDDRHEYINQKVIDAHKNGQVTPTADGGSRM
jgi:hypothetical protein